MVLLCCFDRGETVTINPQSGIANEHHLEYFRFAGHLLGKAFFDSQLVGCHLALPIYKHLLAMPITFHDLEVVDADLVSGLVRCCWWCWWCWCCCCSLLFADFLPVPLSPSQRYNCWRWKT